MRDLLKATLRSLAFLTRLPPARWAFTGDHPLGADAYAFPLAGMVAALPAAGVILAAPWLELSPLVAAVLAIATLVVVTGGLHEDGLGDTADGLGGHHGRERALAIMKDSRIGTYGALALILSLALRITLLVELVAETPEIAALIVVVVAGASRGAMAWLWSSLPSADPGGLAASVGQPSRRTGRIAGAIGVGLLAAGGLLAGGLAGAVLPLAFGLVAIGRFRRFIAARLGGQTGDTLGAAQQIAEIAGLLGFAVAGGFS